MQTITTEAPSTAQDHGTGAIVKIGHGGWSIHYRSLPGSNVSNSTLSGYGDNWRGHLAELEPGALVVDLTAIPWEQLARLALSGPIVNVDVPAGTISPAFGAPRPVDRSARFWGAGSFDYMAAEDYAELAREHGADVYPAQP
jgi:hypothetical protein